jgi:hypothetical protein
MSSITEKPQFVKEGKRSRKASVVGWIMISTSAIILGILRVIADQVSIEVFMIVIILTMILFSAGIIILAKYGRPKIPSAQKIRYPLKPLVAGMTMLILGLVMIFLTITLLPLEERTLPFFLSIGLLFAGAMVAALSSAVAQMRASTARFAIPARILDAFQQIEPDRSFQTKNLSVMKKGDIYILLPKLFNCAYFIRAQKETTTQDRKLRLPMKILRKKYFTEEIGGLPIAKRKGEFIIPVSASLRGDKTEEKYAKVSGMAYLVAKYDVPHRRRLRAEDLSEKFDKATILRIMERLSKDENDGSLK